MILASVDDVLKGKYKVGEKVREIGRASCRERV